MSEDREIGRWRFNQVKRRQDSGPIGKFQGKRRVSIERILEKRRPKASSGTPRWRNEVRHHKTAKKW